MGTRGHVRSFVTNIQVMWCPKMFWNLSVNWLLQSGDRTSTKKLVEDLDILWASKGGNADLSKWFQHWIDSWWHQLQTFCRQARGIDYNCYFLAEKSKTKCVLYILIVKKKNWRSKFSIWQPNILVFFSMWKKILWTLFGDHIFHQWLKKIQSPVGACLKMLISDPVTYNFL